MFREVLLADQGIPRGTGAVREHIAAAGIPFDASADCHLSTVFDLDLRLALALCFRRLCAETNRTYRSETERCADELHTLPPCLGVCDDRACPSRPLKDSAHRYPHCFT